MNFDRARKIADAVLYEGYVLYPYRASARKNQIRWQFGVLAPRVWSEADGSERWWRQTECLVECGDATLIVGKLRFLQVAERRVEVPRESGLEFRPVPALEIDGRLYTTWEEGIEREVDFEIALDCAQCAAHEIPFQLPYRLAVEGIRDAGGNLAARLVREQVAIEGIIRIESEPVPGPYSTVRLRLREENSTPWPDANSDRNETLPAFIVGAHTLIGVENGAFISMIDPPQWARDAVRSCTNAGTWPVMAGEEGERDLILSSPIILEDYPRVAPESPGDLFDATEIDEILTLRTMALTEEEKREARATDPRAAAIIDRVDSMPAETFKRLHGAVRSLREVRGEENIAAPWWDPAADASVRPETDSVEVNGIALRKGSRVRLRPRLRQADAQDIFIDGRIARVEGVFVDVENNSYFAVMLENDPAADFHQSHGRFLYFRPDEVEPLDEREPSKERS